MYQQKNASNDNKKKNNLHLQIKWAQEEDGSCVACGWPYLLTPPPGYYRPYLRNKGLNYFLKFNLHYKDGDLLSEKKSEPQSII